MHSTHCMSISYYYFCPETFPHVPECLMSTDHLCLDCLPQDVCIANSLRRGLPPEQRAGLFSVSCNMSVIIRPFGANVSYKSFGSPKLRVLSCGENPLNAKHSSGLLCVAPVGCGCRGKPT